MLYVLLFRFSKVFKSNAVQLNENQMRCYSDSHNGAVRHHALSDNIFYDGGLYRFSITIEHLEDWLLLGVIGEDVLIGASQDPCTLSKGYGFGADGQVCMRLQLCSAIFRFLVNLKFTCISSQKRMILIVP